jgi:hypothetical protein
MPPAWQRKVPDYCSLLAQVNGAATEGGLVRVFGVGTGCLGRNALDWNAGAWRVPYRLPESLLLWGENIFGDQYGVDMNSAEVMLVNCEGGAAERLPFASMTTCLESILLGEHVCRLDLDLVQAAHEKGLRPSLTEHLSFSLPLVCGGIAELDNLEVLDGEAHLDILGQIIEQSRDAQNGTPIQGVRGPGPAEP